MGLRRCKANETRRQSSRDPPKRRAACMTHSNCTVAVAVASRSFARSKLHQSAAAGFAITASAIYHAGIGQNTTSTSVRSVSLSVRAHDDISPAPLQSRWPLLHGTTQRQLPHSASKGASLTAKAMSAVSVPFDPSAAAALRHWGDGVQMRRSCSCHLARTSRQSSRGMPAASSTCRQPWRLHALGRRRHPRATIVTGQGPGAELDGACTG